MLRVGSVLALLVLAGCAPTTTVRGTVVTPARVPVRAYPRIWVASGHTEQELRIRHELLRHLEHGDAKVRAVEIDDLEPRRLAGRIPPATVVVILELEFEEKVRPEWLSRPESVCGPLECYTRNRSYMYDVPMLEGRLAIRVYDGPTARVLQRLVVEESEEGLEYDRLREHVVERLVTRVRALVDQHKERVEVVMLEVGVARVDRALDMVEAGAWHRGRVLLERAVRGAEVRGLDEERRARVYYDLAMCRRFDPTTLSDLDKHFRAAERPLRRALGLDPRPVYAQALEDLNEHRKQLETVRAQDRATADNYALGRRLGRVPPPPPGYGDPE